MKKLLLILAAVFLTFPALAQSTLYSSSSTGNVGIGTSGPLYPLHVVGSGTNTTDFYVTDQATGFMSFENNLGGTSATGSPDLMVWTGAGSGSLAGAYIDLRGKLEAGLSLYASSNPSGQRLVRLDNGNNGCTNCFAIQLLNDAGNTITSSPFVMQDSAPSNSIVISSSGSIGLGTSAPQSLLHAYNGEVQVGSSGVSCAAANNGAIRYASGTLYYCTGTTWTTVGSGGGSFTAPTVQKFTSGSGTYTTPTSPRSPLYIRVRMVGGGGGGSGSMQSGSSGAGGNGGATTFGSSLLSAGGGSGCAAITYNGTVGITGGNGGTSSLGTGPVGLAITGSGGGGHGQSITGGIAGAGGQGGGSALGGAGSGAGVVAAGGAGATNTGGGGSGGGGVGPGDSGCGGGAGGFVDAIINAPGLTYAYAVGSGGTAGSAGSGGDAGGAGGSGLIIVEEYYQ